MWCAFYSCLSHHLPLILLYLLTPRACLPVPPVEQRCSTRLFQLLQVGTHNNSIRFRGSLRFVGPNSADNRGLLLQQHRNIDYILVCSGHDCEMCRSK
ncbi:hypothetical protein EDC04DRAFT_2744171 [Pisolithus marmoratus]|nr:hypothetical protein EDC04DRAFT_2744171 [Pisolithus marmoratus]